MGHMGGARGSTTRRSVNSLRPSRSASRAQSRHGTSRSERFLGTCRPQAGAGEHGHGTLRGSTAPFSGLGFPRESFSDGERTLISQTRTTLRSSAAPATNAAGADVRRGRPSDSCCAALSKRMYPHGVSPRRQRLFEHHVRLHLLRRGEDTSKLCSSCHQRGWSRCSTRKAERFMLCGAVKAYVSAWCVTATSTLV